MRLLSFVFLVGPLLVASPPAAETLARMQGRRSVPSGAPAPVVSQPQAPGVQPGGSQPACRPATGGSPAPELWIAPPRLGLAADEFALVRVEQAAGDIEVLVCDPEGKALLSADTLNGSDGPEEVPVLAERPGLYRLGITPAAGLRPRRYRYRVLVWRRALATDRERWKAARLSWQGREAKGSQEKIGFFRDAVASWKRSGDRRGEADAAYHLGRAFVTVSDLPAAVSQLRRARDLYRELPDRPQLLSSLKNLASAQRDGNDLLGARTTYEEGLRLVQGPSDASVESDFLLGLAVVLIESGDPGGALTLAQRALSIREGKKGCGGCAVALNVLGRAYLKAGDSKTACEIQYRALSHLTLASKPFDIANTFHHLGDALAGAGDGRQASFRYRWALRIWQRIPNPSMEAATHNNMARAYFLDGDLQAALGALNRAIVLFGQGKDEAGEAQALTNAAWLYTSLGQPQQALAALQQAKKRIDHLEQKPLLAFFDLARARALLQLDRPDQAFADADLGLQIVEGMLSRIDRANLRQAFVPGIQGYYDVGIQALMERHKVEPERGWDRLALELSERARARSLLDSLEGEPVLPTIKSEAIQHEVLDDDSVLLEIFLGTEKSYLWEVTRGSFRSFELPKRSEVEPLASRVAAGLAKSDTLPNLAGLHEDALKLSSQLLRPLGQLPAERRLVLVVPPELHPVPFASLPNPFDTLSAGRQSSWPHPLMLDRALISAPSMAVLALQRKRRAGSAPFGDQVVAFAAARYAPSSAPDRTQGRALVCRDGPIEIPLGVLGPLDVGERELGAIEGAASGEHVRTFKDSEASVERFRGLTFGPLRYLYLSAHGHLDVEDADRSAVVLSAFDGANQPVQPCLFARDVAALRLPVDLVVVSACSSGLGRSVRGEGVLGLGQAFLTAGAKRVGLALWDVRERPTASLMERFHQHWLREGHDPVDSLREAQKEMWRRRDSASPAHWGGFVLLGDWQ